MRTNKNKMFRITAKADRLGIRFNSLPIIYYGPFKRGTVVVMWFSGPVIEKILLLWLTSYVR